MRRALSILAMAAVAGLLIWAAGRVHHGSTSGYWAEVALLALAGLALALGLLIPGGGRPRLSVPVLMLVFLPGLVAAGWVMLAAQPNSSAFEEHIMSWSRSLHVGSAVSTLTVSTPVLAFALGVVLGSVFLFEPATSPKLVAERRSELEAPPDVPPSSETPPERLPTATLTPH